MDSIRKLCSEHCAGKLLLDALENEERLNPGICDRLSGPIAALIQAVSGKDPGALQRLQPLADSTHKAAEEETLSSFIDISSIVPRGKLGIELRKSDVALKGHKINTVFPYKSIDKIAVLEGMPYSNKKSYLMISMTRDAAVMHGKQKLRNLLFSSDQSNIVKIADPLISSESLEGSLGLVLFQALTRMGIASSSMLKSGSFLSNAGHKAVSAVVRVNQGWLFPLESAICFVERPPMLFNHADIIAVQPDRTESWNTTFDIMIYLADGDFLHLQQIDRSELNGLVNYLQAHNIKIGVPEEPKTSDDANHMAAKASDDKNEHKNTIGSDDCSDEDFDPDQSSGDEAGPDTGEQEGGDFSSDDAGSTDSDGAEIVSEDDVPASFLVDWIDAEASNTRSSKSSKHDRFSGPSSSRSQE